MLFNSFEFILLFFPVVLAVHHLLGPRHVRAAARWLGAASVFFYAWWSPSALPLLLGSVGFNYLAGQWVAPGSGRSERARRWRLRGVVSANLVLLGVFKYADFFVANLNEIVHAGWQPPHLLLPIGISFYTFTQIAFVVDAWAGKVQERSFSHYLLFVTYFPHLIAGPVIHHAQMMPQFADPANYQPDPHRLARGLAMFVAGLCKKLLLADPMGQFADVVFGAVASGTPASGSTAWLAATAYSFQIYFDFSGYSDMAVGLSLCLGIHLPINFNSPYRATSIIEFWRRWHISLSTFLRDYLYVPLGGNRHGPWRRHLNLAVTMLLGGLWHGASWTFVLWGGLHGAFLIANHLWRHVGRPGAARRSMRWLGVALTFAMVTVAWVLFRADSLATAESMLRSMAGLNGWSAHPFRGYELQSSGARVYQLLLMCALIVFCLPNSGALARWVPSPSSPGRTPRRGVVLSASITGIAFLVAVSKLGTHSPFLYFQF